MRLVEEVNSFLKYQDVMEEKWKWDVKVINDTGQDSSTLEIKERD